MGTENDTVFFLDRAELRRVESGKSTRLPPMWPGFDSQIRRHMGVELVGSLLCTEGFFSGYSGLERLDT